MHLTNDFLLLCHVESLVVCSKIFCFRDIYYVFISGHKNPGLTIMLVMHVPHRPIDMLNSTTSNYE